MIEVVLSIVLSIGLLGFAEYRHHKTGNGKRFEKLHSMLDNSDQ